MLIKRVIAQYGKSLAGPVTLEEDLFAFWSKREDMLAYRTPVLKAISQAKVYHLDAGAIAYIDSFADDVADLRNGVDTLKKAGEFMQGVMIPAGNFWLEYDPQDLVAGRVRRGTYRDEEVKPLWIQRGLLVQNQNPKHIRVSNFTVSNRSILVDPAAHLKIEKDDHGHLRFDRIWNVVNPHSPAALRRAGLSPQEVDQNALSDRNNTLLDFFIPCVLFSLLSSNGNGLQKTEAPTFTPREEKTARKFGKTWLIDAPRTHVTVRIGPEAEAHLREQAERREFERRQIEERHAPVRHWVSEHERHYRNGKVSLVKGHYRGMELDPSVPTLVVGPKVAQPQEEQAWPEPEF